MSNQQRPAGCLGFLFGIFGSKPERETGLPRVMVNKMFVSRAEAEFFKVLRHVVGDQGYVLTQVPLGRLLYFPGNNDSNPGRGFWWNKMSRRSVDYVVCDPDTLAPWVAIELDEPSHAEPDRQTRDEEVETMLDAAGLVLLRVLTSRTYDTRELAEALLPFMRGRASRPRSIE